METSPPNTTVLLPVLDEVGTIDACLRSLAAQDYRGKVSIVVAEGGSTDGTRDRLKAWDQNGIGLEVINNPGRLQS
ncbi:MAG: glycosyltransferase, partial [Acidimicrobiia bacterium]